MNKSSSYIYSFGILLWLIYFFLSIFDSSLFFVGYQASIRKSTQKRERKKEIE